MRRPGGGNGRPATVRRVVATIGCGVDVEAVPAGAARAAIRAV